MLYAMCGFANFGSLGIMIAGLSTMCPEKRDEVVSLGLKSIVSGTLTTCLLGAIVGVLAREENLIHIVRQLWSTRPLNKPRVAFRNIWSIN